MSRIYIKKKMFTEAIGLFEEVLTLESRNKAPVYMGLADCYRHLGKLETALENYQLAEDFLAEPGSEIKLKKLFCLIELQRLDQSLEQANDVQSLDPDPQERACELRGDLLEGQDSEDAGSVRSSN